MLSSLPGRSSCCKCCLVLAKTDSGIGNVSASLPLTSLLSYHNDHYCIDTSCSTSNNTRKPLYHCRPHTISFGRRYDDDNDEINTSTAQATTLSNATVAPYNSGARIALSKDRLSADHISSPLVMGLGRQTACCSKRGLGADDSQLFYA